MSTILFTPIVSGFWPTLLTTIAVILICIL